MTGLIVPELFSAKTGAMLPALLANVAGPRIALFHDAIGLKFPEHTPASTVTRLPAYLRELLLFDGIAAVSADSADSLRAYWDWLGVKKTPPVITIPLGLDPTSHRATPGDAASTKLPRVLCVGTIEGRKNHFALLQACESLWEAGLRFEVELLGLARPDTAAAALAQIDALQSAKRPLHYHGIATDAELHAGYARCDFTVYPSLIEGFGLPVIESLQHGKPCICSAHGALGESARGGGCLPLDSVDANSLARAIRHLIEAPAALAQLADAARNRIFPSWKHYTDELTNWAGTLARRQDS